MYINNMKFVFVQLISRIYKEHCAKPEEKSSILNLDISRLCGDMSLLHLYFESTHECAFYRSMKVISDQVEFENRCCQKREISAQKK